MLLGGRLSQKPYLARISGITRRIDQGSTIQPYWRMIKRGASWKQLNTLTLSRGDYDTGAFKFSQKAKRTKKFKVYVKINGLKSNVLTIPKA